jgi:hypothetical protein
MSHITLTEEQARILATPGASLEVHDPQGRLVALARPLDPKLAETIRECQRRLASDSPRYPSEKVQALLQRFEEIDREEGMTPEKMEEVLRRFRAGEAP